MKNAEIYFSYLLQSVDTIYVVDERTEPSLFYLMFHAIVIENVIYV